MSAFWRLLELRTMEVVVATGAVRRAKLRSYRHHRATENARPGICKTWKMTGPNRRASNV